VRLTVGQAPARFLTAQYTERDGQRQRFFAGCWGIFGHANVARLAEALLVADCVHYSDAAADLARFAERTGVPVAGTQAGRGALAYDHPAAVGALAAPPG
jgi:TPP-dependent trihydroxycyclohexane-1,2-dione (THcHDO) dehydratase